MTQRSLSLTFNEFQPSDYGKLAQIYDSIFPERARSIDEWKFFDESLDQSKYYWKRYTIRESEKGEIVAFGELGHAPWMFNPDKYWTEIWVDPSKQGQGIGSAIYRKIEEDLRKLGAIAAWASTREDFVSPIKFLVNRGFAEKMRGWESTINPSEGDFSVFEKYRVQAVNNGITFATLAKELQNDPETYRKLYELVQTAFRDVPLPDTPTDLPYDQWLSFEMKNPNLLPDGYMIAKKDNQYVGVSAVWRVQNEPHSLYQGLTGVLREFRGKGIAVALKLQVLDYARKNGYHDIRTFNATTNTGILSINMKLGFKRDTGWITFEKILMEKQ